MQRVKERDDPDGTHTKTEDNGDILEVNGLTLEYQTHLLELHKARFTQPTAVPFEDVKIPCMHVVSDAPYHTDEDTLKELTKSIASFIVKQIKLV